jgi:hypothetical protein
MNGQRKGKWAGALTESSFVTVAQGSPASETVAISLTEKGPSFL